VARAQQGERVRRIGVLMSIAESDLEAQPRMAAFRQELGRLGWNEAANLRVDYRWASGRLDLLPVYAAELSRARPDVILSTALLPWRPCASGCI
jgi:putative ABC transport system substrate-binding protein